MTVSLRRFVACMLLVFLPLQVFAGSNVVSCAESMPHCPGMQAAGAGCCGHDMSNHSGVMDHGAHASGAQSDMSPCAGATTCAPVMSMAATLPTVSHIAILPVEEAWHLPDPASYLSFIPDGLHRPPSFLA